MKDSSANYFTSSHGSSRNSRGDNPFSQPLLSNEREQEQARLLMTANTNYPTDSHINGVENLEPPMPSFMAGADNVNNSGNNSNTSSRGGSPTLLPSHTVNVNDRLSSENSSVSLTVNYLPSKFPSSILNAGGARRRKRKKDEMQPSLGIPKVGGGVDAFRHGEARMAIEGDEDYDGIQLQGRLFGQTSIEEGKKRKMRWNKFKWALFITNLSLSAYSLASIIVCLLTWFEVWTHADIVRIANRPELVLSTIAASVGFFTSLIGWAGILLNNRSFLAIYTLFCWISFIFLVTPGYLSYKRHTFNLEGKINAQWSRDLGQLGRLRIQDQLQCCGYFSPFIEATVSSTCYARSILPGCKLRYLDFERMVLRIWYTIVFSLVPVHLVVIIVALLCSNHVTYRFGKGMMPKAYRLSPSDMAVIMDKYATQLAEQYGTDVASEAMSRSRSNINLSVQLETFSSPTVGYSQSRTPSYYAKHESLGSRSTTN